MADGGTGNLPVIALDAMGGDRAPEEIVAGAVRAVAELDVEILLVGPPDDAGTARADGRGRASRVLPAQEVIAMDDEPATAVRTKKDSSLVRCAEAVRDGRAAAMVGAGNTGATMAAALLRMGRIRACTGPRSRCRCRCPGASAGASSSTRARPSIRNRRGWCSGRGWAASTPRVRLGVDEPTIGLLSNGEEAGKGDDLRKQAGALLADVKGFVGNVEGRDLMSGVADVIVTDGFTGNVALKTLEGAMLGLAGLVFSRRRRARVGVRRRRLEAAAPRSGRAAAPRQHRRRGAARRQRRLRDLARLVVGGRDRERGPRRA